MRILWAGFFMAGLLLTAFGAYERRADPGAAEAETMKASDDGAPWPSPDPSPRPTRLR